MAQIIYAQRARRDLAEIWDFIARDNVAAADALVAAVEERAALIASMPNMGRDRPELGPDILSFLVTKHYLLYYTKKPDGIEVVRVMDTSQDIPALW